MSKVGTFMQLTEEDFQGFRDTIARFIEQEVAPYHEQWMKDEIYPREFWNKLGEAGLLSVQTPEAYGGMEAPASLNMLILEEFSRAGYLDIAVSICAHSDLATPYIVDFGTEEQKQHYLPKLMSGEMVACLAMTEPDAGSDLQSMRSSAVLDGDEWVLNGSKIFISNGILADLAVVAVKTDTSASGAKGISMFAVDTNLPGFKKGRNLEKMGMHAADTTELFFEDVRLPKDALLGTLNGGFGHMMSELVRERLGVSIMSIAHTEGALESTIDYVNERKAFGKHVADFQNTRFRIAEMQTDVEVNRAFFEKCCALYDEGKLDAATAAMAKLSSSEMQCRVIDGCLQLFGGYGYIMEYPICRAYQDARIQRIYAGTSEIMKEIIGRKALAPK